MTDAITVFLIWLLIAFAFIHNQPRLQLACAISGLFYAITIWGTDSHINDYFAYYEFFIKLYGLWFIVLVLIGVRWFTADIMLCAWLGLCILPRIFYWDMSQIQGALFLAFHVPLAASLTVLPWRYEFFKLKPYRLSGFISRFYWRVTTSFNLPAR